MPHSRDCENDMSVARSEIPIPDLNVKLFLQIKSVKIPRKASGDYVVLLL